MAHKLANLIKQTSLSGGASTITLTPGSQVSPNRAFSAVLSNGDTTEVMVVDRVTGDWQAAVYTFSADVLTLVSDHFIASSTGSAVTFATGMKDVYITPLAEHGNPLTRTANFNVIPGFRYDVDTRSNAVTATLPTTAVEGAENQFNDFASNWTTNNFLIDPNGEEFEDAGDGGDPADPLICADPAKFTLVFSAGKYRPR